jgi:hypothetical protein
LCFYFYFFIDKLIEDDNMKKPSCCADVIFFVIFLSSIMFIIIGGISYNSERDKEKTYLIGQCRIIATSTKASTCYRSTGMGKFCKFSSVYLYLSNYESNLTLYLWICYGTMEMKSDLEPVLETDWSCSISI